jgi:hypothetical protein
LGAAFRGNLRKIAWKNYFWKILIGNDKKRARL